MDVVPMSLLSIFGLGQPSPPLDQQLQSQALNLPPWGPGQLSGANINVSQQALNSASSLLGGQPQQFVPLPTFVENVPDDEATALVNLKALYTRSHVRIDHMQRCLHV